ncbi:MAG TPA: SRPBCC family protein [Gemmatales bacterium]|nr:SRPBCC family protein [Gemmatales bacterium]HMP60164.1 SRPBCC family protein [Gemmatales bacterium]
MTTAPPLRFTASTTIPAPPARAYGIIADYHQGHPRIVPPKYFTGLIVEEGGIGAGTVIRVQMRVLGIRQEFRARITEPEPGRLLVETSDDGQITTSFLVEPHANGTACEVTLTTEMPRRRGLAGFLQRQFLGWLLRRMFAEELRLLAEVCREPTP